MRKEADNMERARYERCCMEDKRTGKKYSITLAYPKWRDTDGEASDKTYPAVLLTEGRSGGEDNLHDLEKNREVQTLTESGIAVICLWLPQNEWDISQEEADGIAGLMFRAADVFRERGIVDKSRIGVNGRGVIAGAMLKYADRLRTAVFQTPKVNLALSYGTGDRDSIRESGKTSMLDFLTERAEKSGIAHIDRVKIPILLCHGYRNTQCRFSQAEQLFIAMKDRNGEVPVRLLMFSRETASEYEEWKLSNQERYLREMRDWYCRYLKDGGEKDA